MLIVHVRLKYEIHVRAVLYLRAYLTNYTDYRMIIKESSPCETIRHYKAFRPSFSALRFLTNMYHITRFTLDCSGAEGVVTIQ